MLKKWSDVITATFISKIFLISSLSISIIYAFVKS